MKRSFIGSDHKEALDRYVFTAVYKDELCRFAYNLDPSRIDFTPEAQPVESKTEKRKEDDENKIARRRYFVFPHHPYQDENVIEETQNSTNLNTFNEVDMYNEVYQELSEKEGKKTGAYEVYPFREDAEEVFDMGFGGYAFSLLQERKDLTNGALFIGA